MIKIKNFLSKNPFNPMAQSGWNLYFFFMKYTETKTKGNLAVLERTPGKVKNLIFISLQVTDSCSCSHENTSYQEIDDYKL